MSLITFRYLWCDFEDCEETTEGDAYAHAVRERAKADGWVRVNGLDLCPNHAGEARRGR